MGRSERPARQSEGNVLSALGDEGRGQGSLKNAPLSLGGGSDVVTGPRRGDALTGRGPARAGALQLVEAQRTLERMMDPAREGPGDGTGALARCAQEGDAEVIAANEWGDNFANEYRSERIGFEKQS